MSEIHCGTSGGSRKLSPGSAWHQLWLRTHLWLPVDLVRMFPIWLHSKPQHSFQLADLTEGSDGNTLSFQKYFKGNDDQRQLSKKTTATNQVLFSFRDGEERWVRPTCLWQNQIRTENIQSLGRAKGSTLETHWKQQNSINKGLKSVAGSVKQQLRCYVTKK